MAVEKLTKYDKFRAWYERQPVWIRVLLFPLGCVVSLFHVPFKELLVGLVFLPLFPVVLVAVEMEIVSVWWANRRFWRKLKERGQLIEFGQISSQLNSGAGTLVVDMGLTEPDCIWWIERTREEIDPQHVMPTWHDYENGKNIHSCGYDFDSRATGESIQKWTWEQLGQFKSFAKALKPSSFRLAELDAENKRRLVLVIGYYINGKLSEQLGLIHPRTIYI